MSTLCGTTTGREPAGERRGWHETVVLGRLTDRSQRDPADGDGRCRTRGPGPDHLARRRGLRVGTVQGRRLLDREADARSGADGEAAARHATVLRCGGGWEGDERRADPAEGRRRRHAVVPERRRRLERRRRDREDRGPGVLHLLRPYGLDRKS